MLSYALPAALCAALFVVVVRLLIIRFITVIGSDNDEDLHFSNFILPPRPKPLWLIGNFFDIPSTVKWGSLRQWQKDHGDLTFMSALGKTVLVLNTHEAANDLLGKRMAYMDRPQFVMAGEMMGLNQCMALMPYGPDHRLARSISRMVLGPENVKRYNRVQEDIVILLLQSLLGRPEEFDSAIRLLVSRVILSLTYGLPIMTVDSQYVVDAERTMKVIEDATVPGAYLVDFIPALKHLPSWLPFVNFHDDAKHGREQILNFVARPFEHVKRELEHGTAKPSLVADLLQSKEDSFSLSRERYEHEVMWIAGGLYGAGTATSSATTLTFLMLMTLHPDKQAKAQQELDNVLGPYRLPTLADMKQLPYIKAIMLEVMRWHAVVPLGLGRLTKQADMYKGYYIPANTIVLPNLWAIGKFSDISGESPEDFRPERHLDKEHPATDPTNYVFGFDRRVCPGRYLAESTLLITFACILSAFTISKKKREVVFDGHAREEEIPIYLNFTPHLISYPEKFLCDIRPRNAQIVRVIEEAASSLAL